MGSWVVLRIERIFLYTLPAEGDCLQWSVPESLVLDGFDRSEVINKEFIIEMHINSF